MKVKQNLGIRAELEHLMEQHDCFMEVVELQSFSIPDSCDGKCEQCLEHVMKDIEGVRVFWDKEYKMMVDSTISIKNKCVGDSAICLGKESKDAVNTLKKFCSINKLEIPVVLEFLAGDESHDSFEPKAVFEKGMQRMKRELGV